MTGQFAYTETEVFYVWPNGYAVSVQQLRKLDEARYRQEASAALRRRQEANRPWGGDGP